jgi:hypothetical protein
MSDTYALGILAGQTAMNIPVFVLSYANATLASRAPFKRAVESLRDEGVHILLGPGGVEPHHPRSRAEPACFPWHLALGEAGRLARAAMRTGRGSDALIPAMTGAAAPVFRTPTVTSAPAWSSDAFGHVCSLPSRTGASQFPGYPGTARDLATRCPRLSREGDQQ